MAKGKKKFDKKLKKKKVYPIPVVNNNVFSIFTDGSCLDNSSRGGPGGLSYISIYNGTISDTWLGFFKTTNNRMELLSIIMALEELQEPTVVEVFTDSNYAIGCATEWHWAWRSRGWKTKAGEPIKNKDLVLRILALCNYHDVKFIKVKSHIGIEYNEMADEAAKHAARNPTEVDEGFIPIF